MLWSLGEVTRETEMSNPKRQRQRRLEREQSAIERRLAAAVGPNLGGPLLQGAPIRYEWAERDRGVAHGGIGMIARLVGNDGLRWPRRDGLKWPHPARMCVGSDVDGWPGRMAVPRGVVTEPRPGAAAGAAGSRGMEAPPGIRTITVRSLQWPGSLGGVQAEARARAGVSPEQAIALQRPIPGRRRREGEARWRYPAGAIVRRGVMLVCGLCVRGRGGTASSRCRCRLCGLCA